MSEKILVIAPHPDDETLGCGGTLLRHKDQGDKIYWMIITNMRTDQGWSEADVAQRQAEIERVSQMYGFTETFKLDFPTAMLDSVPYNNLIAKISAVISDVKPEIVYLPNRSDIHTDHQITFNTTMSCCKDFRAPSVKRILMYECLSETEFAPMLPATVFIPNVFIDISDHFRRKLDIFKIYSSEIMPAPLPRSVDTLTALACYRGSRIGTEFAEAFSLIYEKGV